MWYQSIMGKNKKIIIASILGIGILFILTVIFQTINNIKENSQALISQKKELILLENKIKGLKAIEKELKIKEEELEKINKLFIEPEDPVELINFVSFLRKIATDSEIIINISPPFHKKEPPAFLIFQISGQGKFVGMMKFLEKLENNPYYLIEISNLSLKATRENEEEIEPIIIEANLSLKVYSR